MKGKKKKNNYVCVCVCVNDWGGGVLFPNFKIFLLVFFSFHYSSFFTFTIIFSHVIIEFFYSFFGLYYS
jgi:hypothetical protein